MDINAARDQVLIHYNGWPNRWDEWMDCSSPRIAPFRTRTLHPAHAPFVSPSPVSLVRSTHNLPTSWTTAYQPTRHQVEHHLLHYQPLPPSPPTTTHQQHHHHSPFLSTYHCCCHTRAYTTGA